VGTICFTSKKLTARKRKMLFNWALGKAFRFVKNKVLVCLIVIKLTVFIEKIVTTRAHRERKRACVRRRLFVVD
jgi:hypothetical protein